MLLDKKMFFFQTVFDSVEQIMFLPFYFISYEINNTAYVLEQPGYCENTNFPLDQGQNLWDEVQAYFFIDTKGLSFTCTHQDFRHIH